MISAFALSVAFGARRLINRLHDAIMRQTSTDTHRRRLGAKTSVEVLTKLKNTPTKIQKENNDPKPEVKQGGIVLMYAMLEDAQALFQTQSVQIGFLGKSFETLEPKDQPEEIRSLKLNIFEGKITIKGEEKPLRLIQAGCWKDTNIARVGIDSASIMTYAVERVYKPDVLINVGTAGAFENVSKIGQVYVGKEVQYCDRRISIPGSPKYAEYGQHLIKYDYLEKLRAFLDRKAKASEFRNKFMNKYRAFSTVLQMEPYKQMKSTPRMCSRILTSLGTKGLKNGKTWNCKSGFFYDAKTGSHEMGFWFTPNTATPEKVLFKKCNNNDELIDNIAMMQCYTFSEGASYNGILKTIRDHHTKVLSADILNAREYPAVSERWTFRPIPFFDDKPCETCRNHKVQPRSIDVGKLEKYITFLDSKVESGSIEGFIEGKYFHPEVKFGRINTGNSLDVTAEMLYSMKVSQGDLDNLKEMEAAGIASTIDRLEGSPTKVIFLKLVKGVITHLPPELPVLKDTGAMFMENSSKCQGALTQVVVDTLDFLKQEGFEGLSSESH